MTEFEVNQKLKLLVVDMIEFPQPTVCKHFVAAKLLSMMEYFGYNVTPELAGAVVNANDEEALKLLK